MNLGFYLPTNGGTPRNKIIYDFLNGAVEEKRVKDACVFFDSVNFNAYDVKFGMFDSADLWNFTGYLVTGSVDNTLKASAIANNFRIAYLFTATDKQERNLFQIINISREFPVMTMNETDTREFYRITGIKPTQVDELSLEKVLGVFNGHNR